MKRGRVLVVDDDPLVRRILSKTLEKLECEVSSVSTGEEALEAIDRSFFDLVFLDLRLPGKSGIEVLKELKHKSPGLAVVVITAYGSIEAARQALKLGASDFLEKPFDPEQLRLLARRAFEQTALAPAENRLPSTEAYDLVGNSGAMDDLRRTVEQVAQSKKAVLIKGEPGSGKGLVARLIHQQSDRAGKPFIPVNCGKTPCAELAGRMFGGEDAAGQPCCFELANRGMVFLNEISALDAELQRGVLQVMQGSEFTKPGAKAPTPVDVRIISSTSLDLGKMTMENKFNPELHNRLSLAAIGVPPLREHKQDLPILISYLLEKMRRTSHSHVTSVSPAYLAVLENYDFPGNVQELESVLAHSALMSKEPVLDTESLPAKILEKAESNELGRAVLSQPMSLKRAKALAAQTTESRLIIHVLKETNGNFSLSARKLGISRSALYYKIKRYKITLPE